ncbi:MAG: DUF4340 domain-containing protein [Desulfopila sp.]|jgi:hypothetical protein|nr:DUF4340 domain-containing protein [Desulfopila sp.]
MRKGIVVAAILLMTQVGLIVALKSWNSELHPYVPDTAFAPFQPQNIDGVNLSDGDGNDLSFQKKNGQWFLVHEVMVPADDARIESLLAKIAGLKKGLAVATSGSAADRFQVSEENYDERLVLKAGASDIVTIFFGTSPGFRQIHARLAESSAITVVPLEKHEVGAQLEGWIDRDILKLDVDTVDRITFETFSLDRDEDGGWGVFSHNQSIALDPAEAGSLVEKLCDLTVHGFVKDDEAGESLPEGVIEFIMMLKDGSSLTWRIRPGDEDAFVLNRSDKEISFKVSGWQLEEVLERIQGSKELDEQKEEEEKSNGETDAGS